MKLGVKYLLTAGVIGIVEAISHVLFLARYQYYHGTEQPRLSSFATCRLISWVLGGGQTVLAAIAFALACWQSRQFLFELGGSNRNGLQRSSGVADVGIVGNDGNWFCRGERRLYSTGFLLVVQLVWFILILTVCAGSNDESKCGWMVWAPGAEWFWFTFLSAVAHTCCDVWLLSEQLALKTRRASTDRATAANASWNAQLRRISVSQSASCPICTEPLRSCPDVSPLTAKRECEHTPCAINSSACPVNNLSASCDRKSSVVEWPRCAHTFHRTCTLQWLETRSASIDSERMDSVHSVEQQPRQQQEDPFAVPSRDGWNRPQSPPTRVRTAASCPICRQPFEEENSVSV